jgi:hypothetical protein
VGKELFKMNTIENKQRIKVNKKDFENLTEAGIVLYAILASNCDPSLLETLTPLGLIETVTRR